MALAYLMKTAADTELENNLKLTAFIVDHQARPGSSEEAATVARWLQDLGRYVQSREGQD